MVNVLLDPKSPVICPGGTTVVVSQNSKEGTAKWLLRRIGLQQASSHVPTSGPYLVSLLHLPNWSTAFAQTAKIVEGLCKSLVHVEIRESGQSGNVTAYIVSIGIRNGREGGS